MERKLEINNEVMEKIIGTICRSLPAENLIETEKDGMIYAFDKDELERAVAIVAMFVYRYNNQGVSNEVGLELS